MKFIVSSTSLSANLQAMGRVISTKNTVPILGCFLIEVKDGVLSAMASDSETTMTITLPLIESDSNGSFAIEARVLIDSLRELPEQPLTFETNADTYEVLITYQNGQYSLMGADPLEYPKFVEPAPDAQHVSVSGAVLVDGVGRSIFATANDDLRPVMNGLYFDFRPEHFTIAASDAHKLVRSRTTTIRTPEPKGFVLPKKPASLIKSVFPREAETIDICFDTQTASFTADNCHMVCRLIEGRYPNYNAVIPQSAPYSLTVDRLTLLSALKRVSVACSASTSLVKFQLSYNRLQILAQDYDFSKSADESVECQYEGQEMCIGFKATFMVDILGNLPAADVVFQLFDPSRAVLVTPAQQGETEEVLMMIMPMMISY